MGNTHELLETVSLFAGRIAFAAPATADRTPAQLPVPAANELRAPRDSFIADPRSCKPRREDLKPAALATIIALAGATCAAQAAWLARSNSSAARTSVQACRLAAATPRDRTVTRHDLLLAQGPHPAKAGPA